MTKTKTVKHITPEKHVQYIKYYTLIIILNKISLLVPTYNEHSLLIECLSIGY